MTTDREPGWATPAEVAHLHDVRVQTVLMWVARGHTRRRDPDGLIDLEQLDDYLQQRGPRGFRRGERRPGHPTRHHGPPRRDQAPA